MSLARAIPTSGHAGALSPCGAS